MYKKNSRFITSCKVHRSWHIKNGKNWFHQVKSVDLIRSSYYVHGHWVYEINFCRFMCQEKLVVDFLFLLNELLFDIVTAEAPRTNILEGNRRMKRVGQFRPNFHVVVDGWCVNLKHSVCAASAGYWTLSGRTWFASVTFEQTPV